MREPESILEEVRSQFGYLPPLFALAPHDSAILEMLWQPTRLAYLGNSLPKLLIEKIIATLSRECTAPYCMIRHSCRLFVMGLAAGDILRLLETTDPTAACMEHLCGEMAALPELEDLPAPGSDLERKLIVLIAGIQIGQQHAERARTEVRRLFGPARYQQLTALLSWLSLALTWTESHPEISEADDARTAQILARMYDAEPRLKEFFSRRPERSLARREIRAAQPAATVLFDQVLDTSPVGFALFDRDLRHLRVNRALAESAGLPVERMIGMTVRDVLEEAADIPEPLMRRVLATGEPVLNVELTLPPPAHRQSDETFLMSFFPVRDPDGTISGLGALVSDVTAMVNAHRRVQALADELAHAVQVRDDFLSVASHELRTPLTTLGLAVEDLLVAAPASSDLRGLRAIRRQMLRLDLLVNNLLDVSRIAAGRLRLEIENIDLGRLVADVTRRFHDEIARADCTLDLRTTSVIGRWDRMRLEQIVTNLLTNAIKYGRGKPLQIDVCAHDEHARLVVRDHGVGIAKEQQDRIFGRFERAASARHYGGLGLGLWIVRQTLDAMGGSICVDSSPGEGATFTVELPRSEG